MRTLPARGRRARVSVWLAGLFFAGSTIAVSWFHWATFQFHTFDLAFYVQALWLMIHGKFFVTILGVPLMGNHAEPIVFLLAPLFAIFPHPMLPVLAQNIALGSMGPGAYGIARRQGLEPLPSAFLAIALLVAPATGFVALHEFHPEAFAAPMLLFAFAARLDQKLIRFWVFFLLALGCKENIALLLIVYCMVEIARARNAPFSSLIRWFLAPAAFAGAWLLFYGFLLGPSLNRGNVDYAELYSHLGSSGPNILFNLISEPSRFLGALHRSLTSGNLLWATLIPFLFLPVFRPSWLLIASPLLFQHLLSWRSAEWSIQLHYAAPLLPVFIIATILVVTSLNSHLQLALTSCIVVASTVSFVWFGPLRPLLREPVRDSLAARDLKDSFVAMIPENASVTAGLPYLSHLAMRGQLFSLHHIFKGLKTLSRESFATPAPTDFVLVDYGDSATFDPFAGYYHPVMRTTDNRLIPSSDQLFHNWLKGQSWTSTSVNELTLLQRAQPSASLEDNGKLLAKIDLQTELVSARILDPKLATNKPIDVELIWRLRGDRALVPWLYLRLFDGKKVIWINKGLCAPQTSAGLYRETWRVTSVFSPGSYDAEAVFVDNSTMAWAKVKDPSAHMESSVLLRVSLGKIVILLTEKAQGYSAGR